MALFSGFSRKQEQERKALIALLTRQFNEGHAALGEDEAIHKARDKSACDWLDRNRAAIIGDYGDLVEAFFSRDPDTVTRTLRAMGDRAGIVASIPVYFADGTTAVTFTEMAEKIFPHDATLNYTLRQLKPGLPDSAYTGVMATDFRKEPQTYGLAPDETSSLLQRTMGKNVASQNQQIEELTDEVERIGKVYRRAFEYQVAKDELALDDSLSLIRLVAARHRSLLSAFAQGDSAAVVAALNAANNEEIDDEVIALGTADDTAPDFNALAYKSFTSALDIAVVGGALRRYGADIGAGTVIDKVIAEGADESPDSLRKIFHTASNAFGSTWLKEAIAAHDESGLPRLARAAATPHILQAMLEVFDHGALRAGALLQAAEATELHNTALAESLRNRAVAITGTSGFIALSPTLRVHAESVAYVRHDGDKGLVIGLHDGELSLGQRDVDAGAALHILAQNERMIRINRDLIINPDHLLNAWVQDNGKLSFMNAARTVSCTPEGITSEAVLETLRHRPGWVRVGDECANAAHIANAYLRDGDGPEQKTLRVHAGDTIYTLPVAAMAVDAVMDALSAAAPRLLRVGGELFGAPHIANVWRSKYDDQKMLFIANGETLHIQLPGDEYDAFTDALVADHGYMRSCLKKTPGHELVNPAAVAKMTADKSRLSSRLSERAQFFVEFESSAHLDDALRAAAKESPDHIFQAHQGLLNARLINAVTFKKQKMPNNGMNMTATFMHSAGTETVETTHRASAALADRLHADHGYTMIGTHGAVNPARVGAMHYSADGLSLLTPGSKISLRVQKKPDADNLMDKIASAAATQAHVVAARYSEKPSPR